MANEYYPDCFDPNHEVLDDQQKVETNFEALRTVFSSSSGPASPVPFQLWGNTTDNIIKIRNDINTGWFDIFDADSGEIQISDGVRKGSIVQGEDIEPASCTLQCGGGGGGTGSSVLVSDYIGAPGFAINSPTVTMTNIPGMSTLVDVSDDDIIKAKAYVTLNYIGSAELRLKIGTAISNVEAVESGTWSPDLVIYSIGTGWQELQWELNLNKASYGFTGKITGHVVVKG